MEKPSYYQRHREELCEIMREYDAVRRAETRAFLEEHPECVPKYRELLRRKYYNTSSNKIYKEINLLLKDDKISDVLKTFLSDTLIGDKYKVFTPKMIEALKLIYAIKPSQNKLDLKVDGEDERAFTPTPTTENDEASQEEDHRYF